MTPHHKFGRLTPVCPSARSTVAISIIRLSFLKVDDDYTWQGVAAACWSITEICSGLICACLPTLRPLVGRYFPSLASRPNRSHGGGYARAEEEMRRRRRPSARLAVDTLDDITATAISTSSGLAINSPVNSEVGLADSKKLGGGARDREGDEEEGGYRTGDSKGAEMTVSAVLATVAAGGGHEGPGRHNSLPRTGAPNRSASNGDDDIPDAIGLYPTVKTEISHVSHPEPTRLASNAGIRIDRDVIQVKSTG